MTFCVAWAFLPSKLGLRVGRAPLRRKQPHQYSVVYISLITIPSITTLKPKNFLSAFPIRKVVKKLKV